MKFKVCLAYTLNHALLNYDRTLVGVMDFFMRPFKNADVMAAHCDGACNRTGARLVMAVKKRA